MDAEKELDKANKRIAELEAEQAIWQQKAIENTPPEVLAQYISRQQIQTLTHHLLSCRQSEKDLAKRLSSSESQLTSERSKATVLEEKLGLSDEIIAKLKKVVDIQKHIVPEPKGQRAGVAKVPSEKEISDIIGSPKKKMGAKADNEPKTLRDFIHLMSRINRVKLLDASILLSVSPDTVAAWADKLKSKKYLKVKGSDREDTIFLATDKLKAFR